MTGQPTFAVSVCTSETLWRHCPRDGRYLKGRYPKDYRTRRVDGKMIRWKMSLAELLIRPITKPAHTITCTHPNLWTNAVGEDKMWMTNRHSAQIQTFPDSFKLPKTRVLGLKVVGNALPPRLAELLLEDFRIPF